MEVNAELTVRQPAPPGAGHFGTVQSCQSQLLVPFESLTPVVVLHLPGTEIIKTRPRT